MGRVENFGEISHIPQPAEQRVFIGPFIGSNYGALTFQLREKNLEEQFSVDDIDRNNIDVDSD